MIYMAVKTYSFRDEDAVDGLAGAQSRQTEGNNRVDSESFFDDSLKIW